MARPEKVGHDYFPFYTKREDTQMLQLMSSQGGAIGFRVVIQFDRIICGSTGYYADNDKMTIALLHEYCLGEKIENIEKMLILALNIGYYDKEIFEKYNIFTNKELQKNHLFNSQRRKNFFMKKEYMILSKNDIKELRLKNELVLNNDFFVWNSIDNNQVNVNNNSINTEKTEINANNNTEIKLNKIKEKKIKENSNSDCDCDSENRKSFETSINHNVLKSLISFELVPKDPLTLSMIDDKLFELNKELSTKKVCIAGRNVLKTLQQKKQNGTLSRIVDIVSYIETGIRNNVLRKENNDIEKLETNEYVKINEEIKEEDEAAELEKLKKARRDRKREKQENI